MEEKRVTPRVGAGLQGAATDDGPYLSVAVEGSVMQRGAPAAVRHVDAAQERDDHLGTAQSVVGCGHVQRRLPVLVSRVHVGWVVNENSDRLLRKRWGRDSGSSSSKTARWANKIFTYRSFGISACTFKGGLVTALLCISTDSQWIITLLNCTHLTFWHANDVDICRVTFKDQLEIAGSSLTQTNMSCSFSKELKHGPWTCEEIMFIRLQIKINGFLFFVFFTSLLDATARCRGVSHILSLALTRAPTHNRKSKRWENSGDDSKMTSNCVFSPTTATKFFTQQAQRQKGHKYLNVNP